MNAILPDRPGSGQAAPTGALDSPADGLLVSVDGPGGVGKSTLVSRLADALAARGVPVHTTTEPTRTPLGTLIRSSTHLYQEAELAHLVVADRRHHLRTEILPHLKNGDVVITDRYVPSSLVLQRLDGMSYEAVWAMNADLPAPALAVILTADPAVIAARLHSRGSHSRFEQAPGASTAETGLYDDTTSRLAALGWPVWQIDCTTAAPADAASTVADRVQHLLAQRRKPCRPTRSDCSPSTSATLPPTEPAAS